MRRQMLIQFGKLSFLPMSLRTFALFVAGLCACSALNAQTPVLPPCVTDGAAGSACTVGSSVSFDLGQYLELSEFASLDNGYDGIVFTYSISATGLPPGLAVSPSGLISGTLSAAGVFDATFNVIETLLYEGSDIFSNEFPVDVPFTVTGYSGPSATVEPSWLSFNLTQNGAAATQSVTLTNHGTPAVQF